MRSSRFNIESIPTEYWNEVYRDCQLIDAVREIAEELKNLREVLERRAVPPEPGSAPK